MLNNGGYFIGKDKSNHQYEDRGGYGGGPHECPPRKTPSGVLPLFQTLPNDILPKELFRRVAGR
jgi:hypothetical protein